MYSRTASLLNRFITFAVLFGLLATLLAPMSGPAFARGQSKSYIVQGARGTDVNTVATLVERYGGKVTSRLSVIRGVGALLSSEAVASLRKEPAIKSITPNATMTTDDGGYAVYADTAAAGPNVPATDYPDVIGADAVWEAGVVGEGVTVAIVDSGLGPHDGVIKSMRMGNRILAWVDFVQPPANSITIPTATALTSPASSPTARKAPIANGTALRPQSIWSGCG